jgi:hypothetical protein
MKPVDLTGQVFERLTVVQMGAPYKGRAYWLCRCHCGVLTRVASNMLRGGATRSCGCLLRERQRVGLARTHGLRWHPLYTRWKTMVDRCTNPRNAKFAYYGGCGIGFPPEWSDVACFITEVEAAIGPLPSPDMTLDRIDVTAGYSQTNIRWASRATQALNRRSSRHWTLDDERISIKDMAQQIAMKPDDLKRRLRRAERALIDKE